MRINLITKKTLDRILEIQKLYPNLTFNPQGYTYIDMSKLNQEELDAHQEVTDILKETIRGFKKFNNFQFNKRSNTDRVVIRIQLNYGADNPGSIPFTGVNYFYADELHYGFDDNITDEPFDRCIKR